MNFGAFQIFDFQIKDIQPVLIFLSEGGNEIKSNSLIIHRW
jgi:hypothetical protein